MNQDLAKRILDHLINRTDEMVACLKAFASIESPSTSAAAQEPMFGVLSERLEELGFECERLPGDTSGGCLQAAWDRHAPNRASQLLLGHCDTVWPMGTLERMPVVVRGDALHGPGVYDMKGGLVQAIFAVSALRELGLDPEVAPLFFINSDEEIGSGESVDHIRRVAKTVDRAFVMEPALEPGGRLKTSRKGVGKFTVTARGRAAHAGLDPEKGVHAILEMSHVVQALMQLNDQNRGITVNVGTIEGGTQKNVVPARCEIVVDVRVISQADAEQIEQAIHALRPTLKDAGLEIEGSVNRPPMEFTSGNQRLWGLASEAADHLGLTVDHGLAGGGSDGNFTSQFTPTLDGLGAVGDNAHGLNEHVLIEKLPERAALIACLMMAAPLSTPASQ